MPPPSHPLLSIAGRQLDVEVKNERGARPTLVFLHEGLGSIGLWRSYPDDVITDSDHRGLVYSRQGHGWSEPVVGPRPLDFFEREALEVLPPLLEAFDEPAPLIIGHSDGASMAIIYAAHHPVKALVLLAPHVFVERVGVARIADLEKESEMLLERMTRHHRDPAGTLRAWADVWLHPDFEAWNIEHLLGRIECPVLLIQGLDDEYGTMAQLDAVERQLAGPVERLEVENSGHSPHLSQPALTRQTTVDFIRRVGQPRL